VGLTLDSGIDLFLDHVKVERGLSRNSVEAYGRDLAKFRRFAAAEGVDDAAAVEARHLLKYLVELSRAKLAARSQARNLVALRQLFRYLRAERHIARDPTADLEQPRIGRPLPVT
jgi:integrase/recombinase XerD